MHFLKNGRMLGGQVVASVFNSSRRMSVGRASVGIVPGNDPNPPKDKEH
jgi:hypothetical protein